MNKKERYMKGKKGREEKKQRENINEGRGRKTRRENVMRGRVRR